MGGASGTTGTPGAAMPQTNNALTGTAGLTAGVPGQTPSFVPGQNVTSGGWTPAATIDTTPKVPGTNFVGMPAWFQSMVDAQATGGAWADPTQAAQVGVRQEGGGAAPTKSGTWVAPNRSIPVPHGTPIANWHKWRSSPEGSQEALDRGIGKYPGQPWDPGSARAAGVVNPVSIPAARTLKPGEYGTPEWLAANPLSKGYVGYNANAGAGTAPGAGNTGLIQPTYGGTPPLPGNLPPGYRR
jgi:hypothetical protein